MKEMTVKDAHEMLQQYIRSRSDLGTWKAVKAATVEPQNPFDSRPHRKPKLWFVLFFAISACSIGTFVYFNL